MQAPEHNVYIDVHKLLPDDPLIIHADDSEKLFAVALTELEKAYVTAEAVLASNKRKLFEFNARIFFIGREREWLNSNPNTPVWQVCGLRCH